ncbi:hypothetical protein [Nocardia sp. R6R-6]|uniref:hypothetical protein n=1 Tax=Nocardia sp. R6R-6 TaxID=3459303 RepID=UPI00403DF7CD
MGDQIGDETVQGLGHRQVFFGDPQGYLTVLDGHVVQPDLSDAGGGHGIEQDQKAHDAVDRGQGCPR